MLQIRLKHAWTRNLAAQYTMICLSVIPGLCWTPSQWKCYAWTHLVRNVLIHIFPFSPVWNPTMEFYLQSKLKRRCSTIFASDATRSSSLNSHFVSTTTTNNASSFVFPHQQPFFRPIDHQFLPVFSFSVRFHRVCPNPSCRCAQNEPHHTTHFLGGVFWALVP